MSTFESSSSFVAPAAAARTSTNTTRASGLRKTHNHRALTINTTPTYQRANPYYYEGSDLDSDEEEERIRVNLMPIVDEYQTWESEVNHQENAAPAVNISVQLGIVDAARNTLKRAKKTLGASRQILPALTLLAVFFMLVTFGGSIATSSPSSTRLAPSGRSMRITSMPIWAPPANDAIAGPSRVDTPPTTIIGRAARAASVTMRNTPVASLAPVPAPEENYGKQPRQPVPISPSPNAQAAADVVARPPSGTVSAKFRLLYVYGEEQQPEKRQAVEQEQHEHEHPDDLAALFNGGQHI